VNYNPRDFGDYDLVICDEADVIEAQLTQFVSLFISSRMIKLFKIPKPAKVTNTSQNIEQIWQDWCRLVITKLKDANLSAMGYSRDTDEYKRMKIRVRNMLVGLNRMKDDVSTNWIFEEKVSKEIIDSEAGYYFKPIWITPEQFHEYFGRFGRKFVFMSGSFPTDKIIEKTLGIPAKSMDIYRFDSDFPVESRKIYLHFTGDMSMKNKNVSTPLILAKCKEIVDKNPDVKILIHAVSYTLANQIAFYIGGDRVITHTAKDKNEKVEMFKRSVRPLVLVSPVCQRGVDLPHDECRIQIICKAPFLSLGDKFTSARMNSGKDGRDWYISMACQEIIQMAGRGMRSADDFCETHVLDTGACKLLIEKKGMFPQWFIDATEYA
jgi:Rad3-related DNA helicase